MGTTEAKTIDRFDPLNLDDMDSTEFSFAERFNPSAAALGLATFAALQPESAVAKGGEFGIFEGRIVSLAHPVIMALVYATSAFAAFTGWQWRNLRELGKEITEIKKEAKVVEGKIAAVGNATVPSALTQELAELTKQIDAKTASRKELAGMDLKDKHWLAGSTVLGLGVSFAIEGPINTFIRAQKLFPGPHLYAGAGIVVAWALAASLVPQMQKNKDWARTAHIAMNVLALGLFTWQIPTGWEITQKVIKFTKLP